MYRILHNFSSLVAPDKVTIEGPSEAKVGDSLTLTCETGNSNPPASIQWAVDGVEVNENFTHTVSERPRACACPRAFNCLTVPPSPSQATSPNGGWVTKSSLRVTISPSDRNKMIYCYATNSELGETSQETHIVSVLCE